MENRRVITLLALLCAWFFLACASLQGTTPTPLSMSSTDYFYDGEFCFYASPPLDRNGVQIPWYSIEQAATLIEESKKQNDHIRAVSLLPFTLGNLSPDAIRFYLGYAWACTTAPENFEDRNHSVKRFSATECGDLTTQAAENKYYEQFRQDNP